MTTMGLHTMSVNKRDEVQLPLEFEANLWDVRKHKHQGAWVGIDTRSLSVFVLPCCLLSYCTSDKAEIFEYPGLKETGGSSHPHNFIDLPTNSTVGAKHLRHPRLRPAAHKCVAQLAHDPLNGGIVDVCVGAVEVAKRLLQTAVSFLRRTRCGEQD
jgi:hypothetical protein